MDRLTFVASIVGHLAWPLTTLIIAAVVYFRLPKLVRFVKAIRYKDVEVTIREEFAQARSEAERLAIQQEPKPPSEAAEEKALKLAEIDPSIAIIDIWRRLESEIVRLIQHNGLTRFTSPDRFMEYLVSLGKLSQGDILLYRRLRQIRNTSVHAHNHASLSKAEVLEFSNFVELLIGKLNEIAQSPGYLPAPTPEG